MTLTNCTLSGNVAHAGVKFGGLGGGSGGGIGNSGTAALLGCTLSANIAAGGSDFSQTGGGPGSGGGISNSGTLTLSNCTLYGNVAGAGMNDGGSGGGISNGGKLTLTSCTLGANVAEIASGSGGLPATGGGISNLGTGTGALNNTLVAGNVAGGAPSDITNSGSLVGDYDLTGDGSGSGLGSHSQVNKNPLLAPLGDYGGPTQTVELLPGSPAIDMGSNGLALDANGQPLTTDQRGLPRIFNGTVDIGAFESQITSTPPPTPPTPSTPPTPPGLNANQRFVFHLYMDLLGRQPSTAEVNFFGTSLDQGLLTREQLAQSFLSSPEFFTHQVDQLYVRLLGRHADPAALASGAGFLAAGGHIDQLEAVLLGSDEYFHLHGGTNAGFLAGLEADVLGGAGDLSPFQAELAAGTPRLVVAQRVLALPQAAAAAAQLLYQQTLKRSASPSELFFPTVLLLQGNDTAVLLALLSSDEYAQRP
jgi:hypothetical protein